MTDRLTARIVKGRVHLIVNALCWVSPGPTTITSACGLTGMLEEGSAGLPLDCNECLEILTRNEREESPK